MIVRVLTGVLLAVSVVFAYPAWSYDAAMAESYAKLFEPVKGAETGKALHLVTPDAFLNKLKSKEPLVALDVRTPAETTVFAVTLPGALAIPINELFTEANLTRIPTDKTVVVICLSGTRAAAAGTALRHLGFENVYILKGGFKALVAYLDPKEANAPLKEVKQEAVKNQDTAPMFFPRSCGGARFAGCLSRPWARGTQPRCQEASLTGAPGARTLHAGDLAGLFHVTVGKQVEQVFFGRFLVVAPFAHQMVDDMAHIRRHPVFLPVGAHEFEHLPVILREFQVFLHRQFPRDVAVPGLGIDDIALDVALVGRGVQHVRSPSNRLPSR
jgi:rhodanese-related sulfurtransferase